MKYIRKTHICILIILVLSLHTVAAAQDNFSERDKAVWGKALSLINLKRYSDVAPLLQDLLKRYPQDNNIRAELANLLYADNRIEEAEEIFGQLADSNVRDTHAAMKLVEIFSKRQKYGQALAMCEKLLALEPMHKEAQLWKARVLSWDTRYAESLKMYDHIIAGYPQWIDPKREKARVLGWMRRYKNSIIEYEFALQAVGPDEVLNAEMQAKALFYKRFDKQAIDKYKQWLELEPDNLEALYDLGQVYSRQMQWANAKETYEKVLQVIPEYFRAQQALIKVKREAHDINVNTAFGYHEADSNSRNSDVKYQYAETEVMAPVLENWKVSIKETALVYDFPFTNHLVNRNRISAALEYFKKPQVWASAGYQYNAYSDNLKDTHNFFEEVNWQVVDPLLLTLRHQREDVIENVATLRDGLFKDEYKARGVIKPNRRISLGADYKYSDYSDGNNRNEFGVDLEALLLYEPKRLSLLYRYEQYGFDEPAANYFSPSSFHANLFGFEWRQYFNKEELFWGSKDTYYTFRYLVNCDVKDQRGHSLYLDLHHDFSDRFNLFIEASSKVYEHQDVYSEHSITASFKYLY